MSYSEAALEKKLLDLNNSQQSIQQLSLWLIHHRKHHQSIIKVWYKDLIKANPPQRKLTFLYLANDVVQNSKKKYPEFAEEFGPVMKKVLEHLTGTEIDEKTIQSIGRLLTIWQERNIFAPKIQTELQRIWTKKSLEAAADSLSSTPPLPSSDEPPIKKPKSEPSPKPHKTSRSSNGSKPPSSPHRSKTNSDSSIRSKSSKTPSPVDRSETPVSRSDPPEPEELMKALSELENSASSDAVIREKIARLPAEFSEPSSLDSLQSIEEGQKLLVKVNEATELLTNYNSRLQQELKDRQRVGKMISDFLAAQKDLLSQAEERLELYRDKLDKVNAIREDLKSHIQSLPDLAKLPDVTGGLAPLPSAGELFTQK